MEAPQSQESTIESNEPIKLTQVHLDETAGQIRSSAYWFYWIAGLSVINTFMAASGTYFILGLGLSQVIDGMMMELTGEVNYIMSLLPSAFLILIGIFAAKGQRWAFVVGALIYVLDAFIYVMASEWLAFGFHLFVLYKLWIGFNAISEYEELKSKLVVENASA